MIYDGVIQQASKINIHSKPSTSTHIATVPKNDESNVTQKTSGTNIYAEPSTSTHVAVTHETGEFDINLNFSDFSENFETNNLGPISSKQKILIYY